MVESVKIMNILEEEFEEFSPVPRMSPGNWQECFQQMNNAKKSLQQSDPLKENPFRARWWVPVPEEREVSSNCFSGEMPGSPGSHEKIRQQTVDSTEYKTLIRCLLCPRQCLIPDGERGACRMRIHENGCLYSIAYGSPAELRLVGASSIPFGVVRHDGKMLSAACYGGFA